MEAAMEMEKTMVPRTLSGADQYVAAWVARQLEMELDEFGPCSACGIVAGDELLAGVVYNDYRLMKHGTSMQGSIASVSPRWCTRTVLHDVFSYPFVKMGVKRFWASAGRKNKQSRRMLERLGFTYEGCARRAHDGIQDAMVYSMLPQECRWLGGGS